MRDYATVIASK